MRMHPRNPFLAYIHFRCDEVERETEESENARERERERHRTRDRVGRGGEVGWFGEEREKREGDGGDSSGRH